VTFRSSAEDGMLCGRDFTSAELHEVLQNSIPYNSAEFHVFFRIGQFIQVLKEMITKFNRKDKIKYPETVRI
jgi:hypothetical protein